MMKSPDVLGIAIAALLAASSVFASNAEVVEYDPSVQTTPPKAIAPEVGMMSYVNDKFNRLERRSEENADRLDRIEHDLERLKALEARVEALEKKIAQASTPADTTKASADGADQTMTPKAPMSSADVEAAQAAYKKAFDLLMAGKYADAGKHFKDFVEKYSDSDQSSNAYYWYGETQFVARKYEVALKAYAESVKRNGPKAADALLKQGECYAELNKTKEAKATFDDVKKRFPGSTAAKQADKALAELKK